MTPPSDISQVGDEILGQVLACRQCAKQYRLIGQELAFYKQYALPVPGLCPNCRHTDRLALRNPRQRFDRACDNCESPIKSTYRVDRPEPVLCESCFQQAVY